MEEKRSRCLRAARWFFDDVLFSRIALTTLAQWGGIPIVLRYRKRTGAIHFMRCNSARIHKALRIPPGMASGLADHVWSLEEIVILPN